MLSSVLFLLDCLINEAFTNTIAPQKLRQVNGKKKEEEMKEDEEEEEEKEEEEEEEGRGGGGG